MQCPHIDIRPARTHTHTQGKKRKIIANDKENTSPDEKNTYSLFYSIKKNVLEENTFCSLDYLLVHAPLAQIMKGKKGVGICPFFCNYGNSFNKIDLVSQRTENH